MIKISKNLQFVLNVCELKYKRNITVCILFFDSCRWQPDYSNYHHTGQGASFASASAGSINGGGPYGGGHSQANAQSASFNVGPFSASFSAAQSSSG